MLYISTNATPPRLFTGLTAFFSPHIPPSTKASWCHHGGQMATTDTLDNVQMYFGSYRHHCELIERLRAIEIDVMDQRWIFESIKQQKQVDVEPFLYSNLEASNESNQKVDQLHDQYFARVAQDGDPVDHSVANGEEAEGDSSDSAEEVARFLLNHFSSTQAPLPAPQTVEPVPPIVNRFLPRRILKMHSRTFIIPSGPSHSRHETRLNRHSQLDANDSSSSSDDQVETEGIFSNHQSISPPELLLATDSDQIEQKLQLDEHDLGGDEQIEGVDGMTSSKKETETDESQDTPKCSERPEPSETDDMSVAEAKTEAPTKEMTTPKVAIPFIDSSDQHLRSPTLTKPNESSPSQLRNAPTPSPSNPLLSDFSPFFASRFSAQVQSHLSPSAFPAISLEALLSSVHSPDPNSTIRDGLCFMEHGENGFYVTRKSGVTGSRGKRKSEAETSKKGEEKKKRLR